MNAETKSWLFNILHGSTFLLANHILNPASYAEKIAEIDHLFFDLSKGMAKTFKPSDAIMP